MPLQTTNIHEMGAREAKADKIVAHLVSNGAKDKTARFEMAAGIVDLLQTPDKPMTREWFRRVEREAKLGYQRNGEPKTASDLTWERVAAKLVAYQDPEQSSVPKAIDPPATPPGQLGVGDVLFGTTDRIETLEWSPFFGCWYIVTSSGERLYQTSHRTGIYARRPRGHFMYRAWPAKPASARR